MIKWFIFQKVGLPTFPLPARDSLWPFGRLPTRLLCWWDFSGKNTGVGCHSPPPGNLPDRGSKLHLLYLLYCRLWVILDSIDIHWTLHSTTAVEPKTSLNNFPNIKFIQRMSSKHSEVRLEISHERDLEKSSNVLETKWYNHPLVFGRDWYKDSRRYQNPQMSVKSFI